MAKLTTDNIERILRDYRTTHRLDHRTKAQRITDWRQERTQAEQRAAYKKRWIRIDGRWD